MIHEFLIWTKNPVQTEGYLFILEYAKNISFFLFLPGNFISSERDSPDFQHHCISHGLRASATAGNCHIHAGKHRFDFCLVCKSTRINWV